MMTADIYMICLAAILAYYVNSYESKIPCPDYCGADHIHNKRKEEEAG